MTATTMTLNDTKNDTKQDQTAIHELIAAMAKARYDKDPEAIAAAYTRDAAIYSLAPPLAHTGIDVAGMRDWLASWEGPITIEPRDFAVAIAGDTACAYGFMRMEGTKKGSEGHVDFWMRETLVLERHQHSWRIVHEHTSVPFYMDGTLRPAFDLKP